jgi:hypothetical protein
VAACVTPATLDNGDAGGLGASRLVDKGDDDIKVVVDFSAR